MFYKCYRWFNFQVGHVEQNLGYSGKAYSCDSECLILFQTILKTHTEVKNFLTTTQEKITFTLMQRYWYIMSYIGSILLYHELLNQNVILFLRSCSLHKLFSDECCLKMWWWRSHWNSYQNKMSPQNPHSNKHRLIVSYLLRVLVESHGL